MKKNPLKWPLSLITGIPAIVIFWIFTLISISFFPGYNPMNNWMSELGSSILNPKGAIFFNIGCVITGIFLFPFYLGLFEFYVGGTKNKRLTVLTQIAGFTAAFTIIMIGLFPLDYYPVLHGIWASILFCVTVLVFFLPSIALYKHDFTRTLAKYGFVATGVNILLFVFFFPIFEWLTILFAFGFIALIIESLNKRIDKLRFVRHSLKQVKKKKL